jgi:arylsulfatase A-like enzyme
MRAATRRFGLCAAGAALCACSRRELEFAGARLPFGDRLEGARFEVKDPLPVADLVDEVLWVRDGLAGIVVELDGDDGVEERAGQRALTRWTLPLLPAPLEAGGPELPELIDLPLPLLEDGLDDERPNGFWIEDDGHLAVLSAPGRERPGELTLQYTVYAANLAGTALGAGFPLRDLLALRARHGDFSAEALALPAGSTLALELPPVPAGRIEGAFSSAVADYEGTVPEVAVRVGGETLFRGLAGEGVQGRAGFGVSAAPWLDLPGSRGTRTLEIEVQGTPGDLVLFEEASWARPRRWSDGQNTLLLVIDSLRADRLAAYGNAQGVTPNLDRFGHDALRFDEAWSTSSMTLSSVASMLTSTYGSEHLAWLPDQRLGRGVATLAERFRTGGYRTAAFTEGGFVSPPFGLDRGFTVFDGTSGGIDETLARVRAFLDTAGTGPWFVFVHTYEVHAPYEPPQEEREKIERRYPNALRGLPADPRSLREQEGRPGRLPENTLAALRALYDAQVRVADVALGAFFDDLRARRLYDDTQICVTADHGEEFFEHGALGHGDALYPEVVHVPLFLKRPGRQEANISRTEPVSLIDLAPTLLDGADQASLADGAGFDGVSLLSGDAPSPIYADRNDAQAGLLSAFRREHFVLLHGEYIEPRRVEAPELYNLRADPGATNNVSLTEKAALQQARTRLKQFEELYGEARVEGVELFLDPGQRERLQRFL